MPKGLDGTQSSEHAVNATCGREREVKREKSNGTCYCNNNQVKPVVNLYLFIIISSTKRNPIATLPAISSY